MSSAIGVTGFAYVLTHPYQRGAAIQGDMRSPASEITISEAPPEAPTPETESLTQHSVNQSAKRRATVTRDLRPNLKQASVTPGAPAPPRPSSTASVPSSPQLPLNNPTSSIPSAPQLPLNNSPASIPGAPGVPNELQSDSLKPRETPPAGLPGQVSEDRGSLDVVTHAERGVITEIVSAEPDPPKPNFIKRFFKWVAKLFRKSPKNGQLHVRTSPSGMQLEIDGRPRGISGVDGVVEELSTGKHKVGVVFPLGERWERTIEIKGGRKHNIDLKYEPGRQITVAKSPCPYPINLSATPMAFEGDRITFSSDAHYSGIAQLRYSWTVSVDQARISGAETSTITVDTLGLDSQTITATVQVDDGSGEPACRQTASGKTFVQARPSIAKPAFLFFKPVRSIAELREFLTEYQQYVAGADYVSLAAPSASEAEQFTQETKRFLAGRGTSSRNVFNGGCHPVGSVQVASDPDRDLVPPFRRFPCQEPSGSGVPVSHRNLSREASTDPYPTPVATPSPEPPPVADEKKDRITIDYPLTVCYRRPETIRIIYDRATESLKIGGPLEKGHLTLRPGTSFGRTAKEQPDVRISRVTATPTLIGEGFYITSLEGTSEKSLEVDQVIWEWQITPKFLYRDNQPINVNFQVKLYDQANNLIRTQDWVGARQKIELDVFVCTNKELATVSAMLAAIAAAIVGFGYKAMAFLPALLVRRSVYNIYGGRQGAVGDNAQAVNVTQPATTGRGDKGEEQNGETGSE